MASSFALIHPSSHSFVAVEAVIKLATMVTPRVPRAVSSNFVIAIAITLTSHCSLLGSC